MTDIDRQDLAALVEYLQREALPYNERGRRCARALSALEQGVAEDGPLWITEGDVGDQTNAVIIVEERLDIAEADAPKHAVIENLGDDDIPF